MRLRSMIFRLRTTLEQHMEFPARILILGLAGFFSIFIMYAIHVYFDIFDSTTIGYFMWLSFALTILGMAGFLFILLFLAFTSSVSPEEKTRLRNEINCIKRELHVLQSDDWLEPVKNSLGDKFPRISSQQRLVDERNRLIRNRETYLKTIVELVKC